MWVSVLTRVKKKYSCGKWERICVGLSAPRGCLVSAEVHEAFVKHQSNEALLLFKGKREYEYDNQR